MPALPSRNGNGILLGINLFDLERLDPTIRQKMLAGRLELSKHIDMRFDRGKEADEAAVVFKCPLLEAAIICDWIRGQDRAMGDFPTRLYIQRKVSWARIPSYVVLTEVGENGKCHLNPEVFTGFKAPQQTLIPPKPKQLSLGESL